MEARANQDVKVIGKHKVIHAQARELICKLYKFMKKEAQDGPILLYKVQERVALATGVSRSTVQRILKECKMNEETKQPFSTPGLQRPRKKIKTDLNDFEKSVVRKCIEEYQIAHNKRPTLKNLLPIVQEKINFKGCLWSLWKVVKSLDLKPPVCNDEFPNWTSANDGSGNVSDETTVFIKQEALEPDIEMEEGSPEESDPLETVYVDPNIDQHRTKIKVEPLNDKEEDAMEHEILPVNIKAEPLDIIDEQTVMSERCPECDEEVWDLESHIDEQHSEIEGTKMLPSTKPKQYSSKARKLSQPPSQTVTSTMLTAPLATTMTNVALKTTPSCSTSTQVKTKSLPLPVSTSKSSVVDKGKNAKSKQYLVLVPKTAVDKQSVILPIAGPSSAVAPSPPPPPTPTTSLPSCTVDSSETFTISLARFPESQRIAIKKKMLEVVEAVERLKINPEMIVIAHKAEVP